MISGPRQPMMPDYLSLLALQDCLRDPWHTACEDAAHPLRPGPGWSAHDQSRFCRSCRAHHRRKRPRLADRPVDIPSATGKEIGVAQYLVERMRRSGMDTDLPLVDENRPNAVGHLRGRGDGLNLLFTGHMDTSYSGDEEHLAGDGFKPKAIFRDGWVWGLGASNMKSGLASALIAIEAIIKAGIRLDGDVSFGGVVGEIEKTAIEEFQGIAYSGYGIGTRHLVTHGVTADFALLAEPTGMRISIANMGCIWLRITVGGTVAHSALANKPNVVNAITVMHDLQNDIAQWARDYEATHVHMGEHPNVTLAAIRGACRATRTPAAFISILGPCPARPSTASSAACGVSCAPSPTAPAPPNPR